VTESGRGPGNRSEKEHAHINGEDLSSFEGDPSIDDLKAIEAEENGSIDGTDEIEQLRAEAARHFDNYQRAVADMANYRRRKEQEVLRAGDQTRRTILKQFLPVVDDFERAVKAAGSDASAREWVEGFALIEKKLWSVLEHEGVRPMTSVGEPFDPRYHEAVQVEDGASNPDTVVEEYARGYLIGDDILRPAMVKVGSGGAAS
jgi:molecular chaperone GrpE